MQISAGAIRIIFIGHIAVGLLHILHELRATDPVDKHINGAAIAIRQAHLLGHPIGGLFTLVRVVATPVAWPLKRRIGFTKQWIVIGESQQIIANIANR